MHIKELKDSLESIVNEDQTSAISMKIPVSYHIDISFEKKNNIWTSTDSYETHDAANIRDFFENKYPFVSPETKLDYSQFGDGDYFIILSFKNPEDEATFFQNI